MWPMACYTDPQFSNQRIEITKPISLIYILDDIFDVYGTLDQLTLFTDAVNRYSNIHIYQLHTKLKYMCIFVLITPIWFFDFRWELAGTDQLPDYMKCCLSALYDITNYFAEMIYEKHGFQPYRNT